MTKTFAVDQNNDLFIGVDGNLAIVTGEDAVLQACASAAEAQLGEMVFAINQGIPNFQIVWNGSPNILQFESALRKAILAVNGVQEILNLNTTIGGGVLSYTAIIKTSYGQGVINGGI